MKNILSMISFLTDIMFQFHNIINNIMYLIDYFFDSVFLNFLSFFFLSFIPTTIYIFCFDNLISSLMKQSILHNINWFILFHRLILNLFFVLFLFLFQFHCYIFYYFSCSYHSSSHKFSGR